MGSICSYFIILTCLFSNQQSQYCMTLHLFQRQFTKNYLKNTDGLSLNLVHLLFRTNWIRTKYLLWYKMGGTITRLLPKGIIRHGKFSEVSTNLVWKVYKAMFPNIIKAVL